jgi:hypothetical protein
MAIFETANLLLLRGGGGSSWESQRGTYVLGGRVPLSLGNRIALPRPSPCPHPKNAPTIPTRSHGPIPRRSHRPFPLRSRHHSLTLTIAVPVLSMTVSSTLQCFYFFFWDTPGRYQKTYSKTMLFKMQKHK